MQYLQQLNASFEFSFRSALRRNSSVIRAWVNALLPRDAAAVGWHCNRTELLPSLILRHAQPHGVHAMIPHFFALSPNPTDVFRGLLTLQTSIGLGGITLQHHEPVNVVVATQPED